MFNIFRSKSLKALDAIYKAYGELYKSYSEMADHDNEIFQSQAAVIRGDLYTLGASFDLVIAQEGPQFLEKCHKEYGYIPYTAKTYISRNVKAIVSDKYTNTEELHKWFNKRESASANTRISKGLRKRYLGKMLGEVSKHREMIAEALELGRLPKSFSWSSHNINIIEELYLFPKEKGIEIKPLNLADKEHGMKQMHEWNPK